MKINFFKTSVVQEEIDAVVEVMKSGMIAEGEQVRKLEKDFNQFITNGDFFPICVTSGTTALDLGLKALGINEDDEVIVPDFTFIATANAARFQNSKVIFADVDKITYNLNLFEIKKVLTPNTKAIIVVHLFGNPISDIVEIANFCKENNIFLIEDCAQAHGAEIDGNKVGNFGDISCFSFYATKNMSTAEGGITLFKEEYHYKKAKLIYNHGQSEKYLHETLGYNFRMTNIQAAIGNVQLSKLNGFNELRIKNANHYNKTLKNQNILQLPKIERDSKNVFHQYTVLVKETSIITRKEIQEKLLEKGIPTSIYYPVPLHKQPYYKSLGYDENICKNTTYITSNIFSLPIYPGLKEKELKYITESLLQIIK